MHAVLPFCKRILSSNLSLLPKSVIDFIKNQITATLLNSMAVEKQLYYFGWLSMSFIF